MPRLDGLWQAIWKPVANSNPRIRCSQQRHSPMSVRALQKIIASLTARAKIERIAVTAHALRHTFTRNYLQANPGGLVELAALLGHESLDTTAIYTKASQESLAAAVERSELNVYD